MFPVAYKLADKIITNESIQAKFPNTDIKKLAKSIGIERRTICNNIKTSDLLYGSTKNLLDDYKISESSIDAFICVTQSPDDMLPNVGAKVSNMLHLNKSILSYDINLGCSGFIYGLVSALALIKSGIVSNCLIATGASRCKYIRDDDYSTQLLFGDAAASFYLDSSSIDRIGSFIFGTDGSGYENIMIKNDDENDFQSPKHYYMNNVNVFTFTITEVPILISDILKKNNLIIDDIDYFVLHQANKKIIQTIGNELEIPDEKLVIDMTEIGNTSSASIPICMRNLVNKGKLKDGMKILIAGYGVGFSWGGTVITW